MAVILDNLELDEDIKKLKQVCENSVNVQLSRDIKFLLCNQQHNTDVEI